MNMKFNPTDRFFISKLTPPSGTGRNMCPSFTIRGEVIFTFITAYYSHNKPMHLQEAQHYSRLQQYKVHFIGLSVNLIELQRITLFGLGFL